MWYIMFDNSTLRRSENIDEGDEKTVRTAEVSAYGVVGFHWLVLSAPNE
jgi:hypothetical protein